MSQPPIRWNFRVDTHSFTPLHWAATTIAGTTGVVHAWLYTQTEFVGFAVAAVVFVLAVLAMVYDVHRPVLYALGIPFTAAQIGLWFTTGMEFFAVGLLDKILQSILVVLLAYLLYEDWWVARKGTPEEKPRSATD